MEYIKIWLEKFLSQNRIMQDWVPALTALLLFALTIFAIFLGVWLARKLITVSVGNMIKRTRTKWDDYLVKHKFFNAVSLLVAVFLLKYAIPVVFEDFPRLLSFMEKLSDIYFLYVIIHIIITFLKGSEQYLSESDLFLEKPVASYFQLGRILLYIAGFILALSILMGKSPLYFLGAFGAMTAILLLVFKDTILGLVASIQISANDMIRVGDWVEMPKYNADGDVLAINLNTVKVMNWDKTITTVPTHYFISDSFKNWRGMTESGGRRIKRTIHINMATVCFVDEAMREEFKRVHLIADFIAKRQKEIEAFNVAQSIDTSTLINGRRMTNIGVFRHYIDAYLRRHPGINQEMIILVRQMESTQYGVPIEIYCFTSSVAWVDYEAAQSDIFDHLLAAANYFGLEVFQTPSGADIAQVAKSLGALPGGKETPAALPVVKDQVSC